MQMNVAGLLRRRPGLCPGPIHVKVELQEVALGHVFLPVLRFSPVLRGVWPVTNCLGRGLNSN